MDTISRYFIPRVVMVCWMDLRICVGLVDCSLLDSLWERKRVSRRFCLPVDPMGGCGC